MPKDKRTDIDKIKDNFPSYFDNYDVTYIYMPNFGFDIGQEEIEL